MPKSHEARHTPKNRLTASHHKLHRAHHAVHQAASDAAALHFTLPVLASTPDSAGEAAQDTPTQKGES